MLKYFCWWQLSQLFLHKQILLGNLDKIIIPVTTRWHDETLKPRQTLPWVFENQDKVIGCVNVIYSLLQAQPQHCLSCYDVCSDALDCALGAFLTLCPLSESLADLWLSDR